jgi:hypothetical protein
LPSLQRPQIIVCGLGRTGLRIFSLLRQQGAQVSGVVRIFDAEFAQQVQQVFEFDQVLSPMDLAAPTFAAAALGGAHFRQRHVWGSAVGGDRNADHSPPSLL